MNYRLEEKENDFIIFTSFQNIYYWVFWMITMNLTNFWRIGEDMFSKKKDYVWDKNPLGKWKDIDDIFHYWFIPQYSPLTGSNYNPVPTHLWSRYLKESGKI